jgi:transcriptional regulator with XRE-family HTH domain
LSDPTAAPNSAADPSDRSLASAEPIPELIRLGEQLREARQSQGLRIEELAGRLHIGNDQLLALESGDRSHLPEAVFVIAQAKRVASVLGIDVESTIAQLRQSQLMEPLSRQSVPLPSVSTGSAPASPRPLPNPIRTAPSTRSPSRSTGSSAAPARFPWLPLLGAVAALAAGFGMVRALRPAATRQPTPPRPAPTVLPSPPSPARPSPTTAAAPATQAEAILVLRASEPSWLEVRTLTGERLFEGTLEGEKRFPLGKGLEVMAGRPYAVTASVGDQPAAPLGKVDEIVWRRFLTPQASLPPAVPPAPTPPAPAP